MTATQSQRDAMAILKRLCWEVEENSDGRRALGRAMAHLYHSVVNAENLVRVSSPEYRKTEARVAKVERSIRRSAR
jgi:hypothetical protein